MEEFGEDAIFGPKMSIFGHIRVGGKSVVLKYKVFGQVKHDINGTKDKKGSK